MYIFGIDIGGTTIKLGLFSVSKSDDDTAKLIEKWEIATDTSDNGSHIFDDIAMSIGNKMSEKSILISEVVGAGVGVPGPVTKDGRVLKCINLGWDIFNIEEKLSSVLGMKVKAGNDATVATLGEMYAGGAKDFDNVVMITLGTGVGGGVVINGKIVYGTTGSAGEIGHFHVNDEETEKCGCGNKGCLEQYASATGIVRMASKSRISKKTAKDIFDAAKAGDEDCISLVNTYNKYLGNALATVASVVNPQVFVIGGGVSRAGEIITDGVRKYFDMYAFHSCKNAEFVIAKLGNDAGIYGACKLLLD